MSTIQTIGVDLAKNVFTALMHMASASYAKLSKETNS